MILSGELEVLNPGPIEEEDANDDYPDDDYPAPPPMSAIVQDDPQIDLHVPKPADVNPFAHQQRGPLQLQTIHPPPRSPRPPHPHGRPEPHRRLLREPRHGPPLPSPTTPSSPSSPPSTSTSRWAHPCTTTSGALPLFNAHLPGAPAIFTPPASSHGTNGAPSGQQQAYLFNLQRQHMMQQQQQQQQHDPSPSSGPINVRRERSGSVNSTGSGYASPVSNPGSSYDIPTVMNGGSTAVPRHLAPGASAGWDDGLHMGIGGLPMGMIKNTPITVGGGGNGHGYAAMML
ncbi:hypothetical protein BN946_scf184843.g28 [Trametes cinnabarina]|uniref:Uncharacterized protein n=1 Tax=Pycnoporus cinnabarinus TaxID=5643 RepID=A0A060SDL2_PYCCI|nr:hypothetical protein BN946_scf184843.g28 [Trametes cinnabarina]